MVQNIHEFVKVPVISGVEGTAAKVVRAECGFNFTLLLSS